MADRPIVMSAESVRAILVGRKLQSRRVLRERDVERLGLGLVGIAARIAPDIRPGPIVCSGCPYGALGSRLWVREAWRYFGGDEYLYQQDRGSVEYRATENPIAQATRSWRSPIHMPRWASRLTLEITEVRVERVQAITEEDAMAEGVAPLPLQAGASGAWWALDVAAGPTAHGRTPSDAFRLAWDAINGKRPGCSWAVNPWVWVLEFRRVAHAR